MVSIASVNEVTQILNRVSAGELAADTLLPLVYAELRRVAAQKMSRERPGDTLQATALVHEAWLRLGGDGQTWQNCAHFFGAAAEAMRRILVDRARSRSAARHGGDMERLSFEELDVAAPAPDNELLDVHEALDGLAAESPQKAELVKLRYFAGLTMEQAAEVLGISRASAERYWVAARLWLFRAIQAQRGSGKDVQ